MDEEGGEDQQNQQDCELNRNVKKGWVRVTIKRMPLKLSLERLALLLKIKNTYCKNTKVINPTPMSGS